MPPGTRTQLAGGAAGDEAAGAAADAHPEK